MHVGTDAMAQSDPADADRQPGETPPAFPRKRRLPRPVPGDPADPARCHVDDGPAVSVSTAQMITCTAALSWMLHDRDGTVLDLGRRRRRPSAALRRAARERDKCRCRFPGCESRRIDLHHIQYWSNGGRTSLENLIGHVDVPGPVAIHRKQGVRCAGIAVTDHEPVDGRDGGGEVQGRADAERLMALMPGRRAEVARGRLLAGIGQALFGTPGIRAGRHRERFV